MGTNNEVKIRCLVLELEIKIKGNTDKIKTNRLAVKLPINENIWIKNSFDDRVIDGINHGNPVNNFALKYSNRVKKTIIKIIEEWFFFESNLAKAHAIPQKIDNKKGNITIANGISTLW